MTIELFRGEHPARPLDGCWTPDPIGAATFAVAPGLDGQGVLITALLSTEEVTVEDCAGMVRPAKGGADAVFAADDPSLRSAHAARGVDWLTYTDFPAQAIWWDSNRQVACESTVGFGIDRLHLGEFITWRCISDRGRQALRVRHSRVLDTAYLTELAEAYFRTLEH